MPNNWMELPLSEVCSLITDGTHHSPENSPTGEFRYITAKNIKNNGLDLSNVTYVDRTTHEEIYRRCPVECGDVLYIKDGATTGIATVNNLNEQFSLLSSVAILRPQNGLLSSKFLAHWLNSPDTYSKMTGGMTGTAIKRLVLKQIRNTSISVPSPSEQTRIVEKIDALFERSRAAREELARIPKLIERYRQAVLEAAFRGDLTADWRNQYTKSQFPYVALENLCETITDGDHQAPPRASNGLPFITISSMNKGRVDLESASRFVPDSYYDGLKESRRPRCGDVLFSVTGSIAIPAFVDFDEKFVFQRHIAILKPLKKIVSGQFIAHMLASPQIKEQAFAAATGTAQLTIPLSAIRRFDFPFPSIEEQLEVVKVIEEKFSALNQVERLSKNSATSLSRLDQAILDKAFRGELVQQDPNDEPASVLLERIKAARAATPAPRRGRRAKPAE